MKSIIIYYSLTGNTRLIAETIANETRGDIMELKTKEEKIQPTGFMKYVWGGRQVIFRKKPELLPLNKDISTYDMIFIGTPVWAFTYTPALRTFFDMINIRDKKIILFCTHEGGKRNTLQDMREKLKGNTIVKEIDFFNVAKNKTENIEKAKQLAREF